MAQPLRRMGAHKGKIVQLLQLYVSACVVEDFSSDGLADEHRLHVKVDPRHLTHIVEFRSMRVEAQSVDVDERTGIAKQRRCRVFGQNVDSEWTHVIDERHLCLKLAPCLFCGC